MWASGKRSVLRRWARIFASALSVLTLADEIAFTPFAWASVRSTWSESASLTQDHPVVHSTAAAWSPGIWAK